MSNVGFVGFDLLPQQYTERVTKNGLSFNVMFVGPEGIGKTTLINSLFGIDYKDMPLSSSNVELNIQTSNPPNKTIDLKFTIIETKNFEGCQFNRSSSDKVLVNYIDSQFKKYFEEEMKVQKTMYNQAQDTRVHCCIYMLTPTRYHGGLKPIDKLVMKQLHQRVCLIPVIAKSDILTEDERNEFKKKVLRDIEANDIEIYEPEGEKYQLPFAVSASNDRYVDDIKSIRAILFPWGKLSIDEDSEFSQLRDLALKKNMLPLIRRTDQFHYERYRKQETSDDSVIKRRLASFKSGSKNAPRAVSPNPKPIITHPHVNISTKTPPVLRQIGAGVKTNGSILRNNIY